jgi:hypothetical protein
MAGVPRTVLGGVAGGPLGVMGQTTDGDEGRRRWITNGARGIADGVRGRWTKLGSDWALHVRGEKLGK